MSEKRTTMSNFEEIFTCCLKIFPFMAIDGEIRYIVYDQNSYYLLDKNARKISKLNIYRWDIWTIADYCMKTENGFDIESISAKMMSNIRFPKFQLFWLISEYLHTKLLSNLDSTLLDILPFKIFKNENEKTDILEEHPNCVLIDDSNIRDENYRYLIHGASGLGKSTFAMLVYNSAWLTIHETDWNCTQENSDIFVIGGNTKYSRIKDTSLLENRVRLEFKLPNITIRVPDGSTHTIEGTNYISKEWFQMISEKTGLNENFHLFDDNGNQLLIGSNTLQQKEYTGMFLDMQINDINVTPVYLIAIAKKVMLSEKKFIWEFGIDEKVSLIFSNGFVFEALLWCNADEQEFYMRTELYLSYSFIKNCSDDFITEKFSNCDSLLFVEKNLYFMYNIDFEKFYKNIKYDQHELLSNLFVREENDDGNIVVIDFNDQILFNFCKFKLFNSETSELVDIFKLFEAGDNYYQDWCIKHSDNLAIENTTIDSDIQFTGRCILLRYKNQLHILMRFIDICYNKIIVYPNAFKEVLTSMARQLKDKNDDEKRRLSQVKLKKSKSKHRKRR